MNSIVNLFSNFKEFYSEINGATLTGAIDVVVVEQPNGSFMSSPFHVRFGKLGVLRSREKVVDIEVNGEPVDLQMKLGESGEAFFVEECAEDDSEVPEHMATSPIPSHSYLSNYEESVQKNDRSGEPLFNAIEGIENLSASSEAAPVGTVDIGGGAVMRMVSGQVGTRENDGVVENELLPRLRRNSVDLSNENPELERAKFENQRSEYSYRRHTDNLTNRPDLSLTKKEYTTQKLRQELNAAAEAAEQEQIFHMEGLDVGPPEAVISGQVANVVDWEKNTPLLPASGGVDQALEDKHFKPIDVQPTTEPASVGQSTEAVPVMVSMIQSAISIDGVVDSKSKKKRRKKSLMKKKNTQRKNSASSSSGAGSNHSDPNEGTETDSLTVTVSSTGGSSLPKEDTTDGIDQEVPDIINQVKKEENETLTLDVPTMSSSHHVDLDIHFFSDTDIGTGVSPQQSRPSTPIQSDTEFEMSQRKKPVTEEERLMCGNSWNWGELPTQVETKLGDAEAGKQAHHNSMLTGLMSLMKYNNKKKRHSVPDGMYLSELDKLNEPEIAQLYFPSFSKLKQQQGKRGSGGSGDEDRESGNGTSIPQSPASIEDGPGGKDSDFDERDHLATGGTKNLIDQSINSFALSLCGGLANLEGSSKLTDEQFDRHRLQYANVLADPRVFKSPDLVVRINNKYYSWEVACPQVMTILAFQCGLPNELLTSAKQKSADGSRVEECKKEETLQHTQQQQQQQQQQTQPNVGGRWWYWRRSNESKTTTAGTLPTTTTSTAAAEESGVSSDAKTSAAVGTQTSRSNSPDDIHEAGRLSDTVVQTFRHVLKTEDGYNGSLSSEDSELATDKSVSTGGFLIDNNSEKALCLVGCGEKYRKTLRLSSERIKELNLLDGMNEIEFSVTTAYQGTTRCKCYLFKWKHNDKVVISDIDGTITKSDVLGHILPMVGKSWDQIGVAQLFSKIEENGYKMLYLSARAIGQAKTTRGYLQSIRQGDVKLPDGPLLLNPTSLMSAFHREVIEKKPEQFKIACLNDIRDLFPERNPFYAGYGNRINDVWAYRAVGIPTSRIFTINPKGELKHELTQTFQSTYANMAYIVDQLYPPIKHIEEEDNEYTSFNYWREPVPEIDFDACDISGFALPSSGAASYPFTVASGKVTPTATLIQQALPTIPEN
ncbi:phosphatidate phosphatase LPIN3 [Anopheles maculipalpis]|uniref:phosphatidate phosphatase LPIN3 n=1 Tax=Anopheles maculipalpis TaxID=1496333 RepID=UPI0021598F58|nr:phosphatidate phosphatase LPIN3 [Anopheles maculipalpis]